jgi:hypothetical protein
MQFERYVFLLSTVSLWAGAAWAQQPSVSSIIPRVVNLPVVNVVSSQTVEVNVVNLAPSVMAVSTGSVPTEGSTASCTGAITFYTSTGSIGSGTPFTIGSGQIFSANLPYSAIPQTDLVITATGRTPVRAVVTITETVGARIPCALATNLETFDTSTGVTNIHIEGSPLAFPGFVQLPANVYGRTH